MRLFISLSDASTFGPLVVDTQKIPTGWVVTWLNKMTNNLTKLYKNGEGAYVVENSTPRTPSVDYTYKTLKEACMTFFVNADDKRVNEDILKKARESVSKFIKIVENLKLLEVHIKRSARVRERKALNTPVLIGKNKESKGILLGLNWSATKAKVAIIGGSGVPARVVELSTNLVWIP